MRKYICHTDHNLWDIIVDGDLQEEAAPAGEQSGPPAPKTAKQLTAKRNQERVKSILLLAILDEYLLKFHNVLDAKSLWAAIKSRFGGNDESKKTQRKLIMLEELNSTNRVSSTPGADEVVCSFFAQQTTSPPLDNEDLQQIDQDDLEELDIRWQSKVECYNYHRKGHFAKECKSGRNQGKRSYGDNGRRNATTNEPSSQALVAQDGLGGYNCEH
ncbi:ribonuclease H-like domain-containing protein [Tanacetum coccineum]